MGENSILVFDIGGTNLRAAIYHPETGALSRRKGISTRNYLKNADANGAEIVRWLLNDMHQLGNEVLDGEKPVAVSVAFAGPVDERGSALTSATIWGDRYAQPVPLQAHLASLWPSSTVFVENDMTAAGYAYDTENEADFCIITVSSGVGIKVFINGQPFLGVHNRGGEIGHFRIDRSDTAPACDCGGRGHLSAIASGRAAQYQIDRLYAHDPAAFKSSLLYKNFGEARGAIDNQAIVAAFQQGDRWTVELIRRIAEPIGSVIEALHLTLGLERFIIVGGFALALGEGYRKLLVEAAWDRAWSLGPDWETCIALGKANDNAGLIGAGRLAAKRLLL